MEHHILYVDLLGNLLKNHQDTALMGIILNLVRALLGMLLGIDLLFGIVSFERMSKYNWKSRERNLFID